MGLLACPLADDEELENDYPRAYYYFKVRIKTSHA